MSYVQELPRTRRRRHPGPSERKVFLIAGAIFYLNEMTWVTFEILKHGYWYLAPFVLLFAAFYRLQTIYYRRAKAFEERFEWPYPPLPRSVWLLTLVLYLLAIAQWISWP